jgi:hypothetical protein
VGACTALRVQGSATMTSGHCPVAAGDHRKVASSTEFWTSSTGKARWWAMQESSVSSWRERDAVNVSQRQHGRLACDWGCSRKRQASGWCMHGPSDSSGWDAAMSDGAEATAHGQRLVVRRRAAHAMTPGRGGEWLDGQSRGGGCTGCSRNTTDVRLCMARHGTVE